MKESVAFDELARVLAAAGSAVHAAEAHGCLCGALCARREYGLAEWLDEILPDEALRDDGLLAALHAASVVALADGDMEFEPVLPDDEQPLAERVEALGAWCQGFLYGFGAAGTANRATLPEDVTELLADLARIANAGAVGSETLEAEEEAYAELVEFLRVGVQLAYDELAALRAGQPASCADH